VTEMIELTKKLSMLILNRIITFKYWPAEDQTWSEWRCEVILRSVDFQGDPSGSKQKKEKELLAKLVQNQLALALYDPN
jgi:hypothetical protein